MSQSPLLLVAGGQLDPNIGRLLARVLEREVPFRALLVGPSLHPRLAIDLDRGTFRLDDEVIRPSACFIRHDVFLPERIRSGAASSATLNWFHAVKGWALADATVRLLNRRDAADASKVRNLVMARAAGLRIPPTWIGNDFASAALDGYGAAIHKPVAGGELTRLWSPATRRRFRRGGLEAYPRFVQPRLSRPELRVFRIGSTMLGFGLESPDVDYRRRQRVSLEEVAVPPTIAEGLERLCDRLGLDFAAADFMRDPTTGELVFLEVNSQPMFVAFDLVAEGRLCDAILDTLCVTAGHAVRPCRSAGHAVPRPG